MSRLYIKDVLAIAEEEIGYLEKASNRDLDDKYANPGAGNWTKYGRDLFNAGFYNGNKNGYDWCTQFVDWCIYKATGSLDTVYKALCYTGPYGASCTYSVRYYSAAGRFYTSKPQPGDQIFFGTAGNVRHTGIVHHVTDGVVYTIEGNACNAVKRRCYALSNGDILGYGRPIYDGYEAPADPGPENPNLPTHFNDVPAGEWFTGAVEWGVEHGITKGIDSTHFGPYDSCTRAEVMVMLQRVYELLKGGG